MEKVYRSYYIYKVLIGIALFLCSLAGEAQNLFPNLPRKSAVADSILECIFNSASLHSNEVKEYKADLYLKGRLQVHKQNRIKPFFHKYSIKKRNGMRKYFDLSSCRFSF